MPALSRKSIFLMCAATALIVCVLMLTACGNDSVPTEQPLESVSAAPAAPAAAPEPAAPAEPATAPAEPDPVTYQATCIIGSKELVWHHFTSDDWEFAEGRYHFINIGVSRKEAYFNGTCLIEQE